MNQTKRNLISSFIVFGAFLLFLSACNAGKHAIDDGLSRLVRSTAGKAAKSGGQAEAKNHALEAIRKLMQDNPKLLEYAQEKGPEKVSECIAEEAVEDLTRGTDLDLRDGGMKSGCFPR